jgi:hypothetical protein
MKAGMLLNHLLGGTVSTTPLTALAGLVPGFVYGQSTCQNVEPSNTDQAFTVQTVLPD